MTLPDPEFWRGRRVLVTGHTGFKGGWLSLWLAQMGARVTGLALPPEDERGIYTAANIGAQITPITGDIRDASVIRQCIRLMRPQIVFHLAAQSLVRRAHADPVTTYETNVLGTAKVLEEARRFPFVRAAVVVTSDKVYANTGEDRAFTENDRLGGHEPYGASKAAAEFVVSAFRRSLGEDHHLGVASVRAGNVIGGGDWAEDRLVPDAMGAFTQGRPLAIRNPAATRPWQYVLDPLCGYLLLAERLVLDDAPAWRSAWNFGPREDSLPVSDIADRLVGLWNGGATYGADVSWQTVEDHGAPYEARTLAVDSSKARRILAWRPRLDLDAALEATVGWYQAQANGATMTAWSRAAIESYIAL
jgi:CDP-glucose 4,6-dehydratase